MLRGGRNFQRRPGALHRHISIVEEIRQNFTSLLQGIIAAHQNIGFDYPGPCSAHSGSLNGELWEFHKEKEGVLAFKFGVEETLSSLENSNYFIIHEGFESNREYLSFWKTWEHKPELRLNEDRPDEFLHVLRLQDLGRKIVAGEFSELDQAEWGRILGIVSGQASA